MSKNKKRLLLKCPSVVLAGRIPNNSRYTYLIGLSVGILYQSPKSKEKFINHLHPYKIVKIGELFFGF